MPTIEAPLGGTGAKLPRIKALDENGVCQCPCELEGGSCPITFEYTNINQIQDDSFDFYLINADGSEKFIGNINGHCKSNLNECDCAAVDVFSFTIVVKQEDLQKCEPCAIKWRSVQVADNGCGTFGTFRIYGPYGEVPDAGSIGGSGTINLRNICIDPEAGG